MKEGALTTIVNERARPNIDQPYWSVMIPIYNPRADYLAATLKSVLDQERDSNGMQIEVIDDCSPSGSPENLVRSLAGNQVAFHREEQNLGLAGIWNKCIERATGQWVHILHQDDLVYPGFYEALRAGIEKHPDVGAAFCRHAYCDGNGHWLTLSPLEMPEAGVMANLVEPLVTGYHIQCASIVVKHSTYQRLGGFNPELKHALDWEMWIRIANSFPLFYEPQILAAWRTHPKGTTSKQMQTGENIRDIVKAINVWKSYMPNGEARRLSELSLKRFAFEALDGAQYFMSQKQFEACQMQILSALSCNRSFRVIKRALRIFLEARGKAVMERIGRN
jgi:glycosyltransferase involved in cell wall biosynthesis